MGSDEILRERALNKKRHERTTLLSLAFVAFIIWLIEVQANVHNGMLRKADAAGDNAYYACLREPSTSLFDCGGQREPAYQAVMKGEWLPTMLWMFLPPAGLLLAFFSLRIGIRLAVAEYRLWFEK